MPGRLTPALLGALLVGAALSVTTHRLAAQATGADEAKTPDTSTEQLRQDTSAAMVPNQDGTHIQGADAGGGPPAHRPDSASAASPEMNAPMTGPDSGAADSAADSAAGAAALDSTQTMRKKKLMDLEQARKEEPKSGYEQ